MRGDPAPLHGPLFVDPGAVVEGAVFVVGATDGALDRPRIGQRGVADDRS